MESRISQQIGPVAHPSDELTDAEVRRRIDWLWRRQPVARPVEQKKSWYANVEGGNSPSVEADSGAAGAGEVESFTPRDLRRTARSYFPALNISQEVSRKIMNHSLEGIDRVYDRYDYMDQMREALESFSSYISSIVEQPDLEEIDHKMKGDRLSTELIRVNFS